MGDIVKFRKPKPASKPRRPHRRARSRKGLGRLSRIVFALTFIGGVGIYQGLVGGSGSGTEIAQAAQIAPVAQIAESARQPSTTFKRCSSGVRSTCVVDGDTIWHDGVKIRLADIDTPEVSKPQCAKEKALGERATARLIELVNSGRVEIRALGDRDEDKFGRKLRVLTRDGRSIGDILVSEGLARTWTGRRQPWC